MTFGRLVGRLAVALSISFSTSASAQLPEIRGYFLSVALPTLSGPFTNSVFSELSRLRLMASPTLGPVELDVAYENLWTYRSRSGSAPIFGAVGGGDGTDWLPLQGNVVAESQFTWRSRLDRLKLSYSHADRWELSAGRQTISWATTLFLTPADPFIPFDPSEPFREYRAGVDALRVRASTGPFSEVDLVLRPADTPSGNTITALGRATTVVNGWEVGGWAGVIHDDIAGSLAATVTVAGAVIRSEAVVRRSEGETVVRFVLGVDRSFSVSRRVLYLVFEYQRDGFGYGDVAELPQLVLSQPFQRGELQLLGRNAVALQSSYQAHPLVSLQLLVLTNLNDPSALLTPAISFSAGNELSLRGGLFLGIGADVTELGLPAPASEYGPLPTTIYISASAFF